MKSKLTKLFTLLTILTLGITNLWGADVTIFSANFSDAVWASHATICNGSTAEETVEGILFRSNNSSKNYSVADGALTFCDNNIGDNYYFLIHLEDVNGSVHVSFGTVSNSQRISYKWFEQTARPTSSSSATATAGSINTNKEIALDYSMTGSGSDLWLMVGRQGSGQKTVIKTITITTPAAADVAPAITAPTTDQSATYTVGETITALSITASGTPTPTYQWYSNSSASTTGATAIDGATNASYTPSNAAASDLYYYCVATNSEGSATSHYFHVTVNAAVATAPSFTSPASEPAAAEYHVGDVISALEVVAAGYPAPTLQWYSNNSKSTTGATLISGAESASYTPSNAAESDLYYYCVASNSEGDAQSEYFHVTVLAAAPISYCAELYPATSGASPTAKNEELLLQSVAPNASFGGKIYTAGAKDNNWSASFTYTANGLQLNKGGADSARVELTHLMQVGTVITATLVNPDASKARGYKLLNMSKTVKATWQATTTDPQTYTYTVVAGDGLAGTNMFLLNRAESSALKELKVSNCGAELHALTSAVSVEGKATVTLSKSLIAEGGTATATYSDIDAAYEFDEWQISGTDATLSSTTANPTTITMGSTDAVVTLKLKAAAVKHTVTYYDDATELGTELVNEGANPSATGIVVPHKLGYTFGGWSTTNGGAAVALNTISVAADMPLYAVYSEINCSALTGTIFSLAMDVAPAANCTIKSGSGFETSADLDQYAAISGGIAMAENSSTSNHLIITTDPFVQFQGGNGYVHISFDCALKEGDKIKTTISNQNIAYTTTSTRSTTNTFTKGENQELPITKGHALENANEIYLWAASSNGGKLASLEVIRPVKHTVSFNMNGHGDDIDPQYVVDGAKATEPTPAPTASGYRFVKWQLSGADYDFDAAVTGDITLDAVWQKTWTVTFDSNGGSDVDAATVDDGQAVAEPAAPTQSGYDFVEWQLSGSAYNFATPVTDNITLTAIWEVAQTDASLSALSYNGNAIDVNSAVDVAGVQTYNVLLPWMATPTVDPALISFTKSADAATISTALAYDDGTKTATFAITSGNGLVTVNYAVVFAFDAKRGTSIIKATTGNVVTGLIGGTIDQSYSGTNATRKLNKNDYFGIQLAEGNFQEGDVLIVNITTAADLGNFMVYADAARTELIADQGITYTKPEAASPVICPTGEMRLELPAAVNGHNTLYLSRENGNTQWNVTFSYLEVTRLMSPAIKSFKFGENAATIDEEHKTISIDVPYLTDVTALTPTVEAYGNNGATYTPAGETDFTSSVNYVVTDGYSELSTTYAVTVNVAAPSENANLASLAVAGYTLDFDPAVVTYNVVLDYGTTVLPTITYEVEEVGLATADKVEDGVNGATTITVTPQAGVGYEKVYTINFSVNTTPKYVIYDGSTGMTAFTATSFEDDDTHFAWAIGSGITPSADNVPNTTTYSNVWGGKTYTKMLKSFKPQDSNTTQLTITVPENYLAKIRLVGTTNSNESMRKMFVSKEASRNAENALDGYIIESDSYNASGFVTNYLLPGVYYIGSTDACRLYELSVTLTPIDYSRTTTEGRYGTICLPNGGVMVGAELYEVAYYGATSQKVFLDQIPSGEMVAGRPYIFLPNEGASQLGVFYTDAVNADAGSHNGLIGSYTKEPIAANAGNYILLNNQYCPVESTVDPVYVGANKAYIKLGEINPVAPALKPGAKRVGLGVAAPQTPTDIDNLNATDAPVKVMINGQMYIIRGEKMYNANGQLVK